VSQGPAHVLGGSVISQMCVCQGCSIHVCSVEEECGGHGSFHLLGLALVDFTDPHIPWP
jgi:hypothetical protein